jgi:hypothetical protein
MEATSLFVCMLTTHTKARYHFIGTKNDRIAIVNRDDIDGIESNSLKN